MTEHTAGSGSRGPAAFSCAAVFLSAALLFSVQLFFVKTTLPLFGGTPAVWNTAVFFFQATLLAGYLYVHLLRTYCSLRNQIAIHAAFMLAACALLPVHIMQIGGGRDASETPILDLLLVLTAGIGLPFFVLSATSPLVQAWLAQTRYEVGKDPYFLYAASNAGSILGLLAYPFALEPFLGLQAQSRFWSLGYYALMAVLSVAAISVWKERREPSSREKQPLVARKSAGVTNQQRLLWVLLACVPSSLMLGVTTYLSTAIAPIPMLWMIPLATYLITLILAFARTPLLSRMPAACVPSCAAFLLLACAAIAHKPFLLLWFLWLHVTILFVFALMCHRRLAQQRPAAEHVTAFYLWISVGGALGGLFNALIAPLIFSNIWEYPLALCAAVALERATPMRSPWRRTLLRSVFFAAAAADVAIFMGRHFLPAGHDAFAQRMLVGSTAVACLASIASPRRLALCLAVLFGVSMGMQDTRGASLLTERDFFGVKEVSTFTVPASAWPAHKLMHNGTVHGVQSTDPLLQREPMGYYAPFQEIVTAVRKERALHDVGVIGLGVGTSACSAAPGERWVFYEIDPEVAQIARDPRYFSYLAACAPQAPIVLGDARVSLLHDARSRYDLMEFDAYSSDQIPVHLITREALGVYREHLSAHGILVFHISNRTFDLSGVLGNMAADAGLTALIRVNARPAGKGAFLQSPSIWVIMADAPEALHPFLHDRRWSALPPAPGLPLWTDDYSSLIRILKRQ